MRFILIAFMAMIGAALAADKAPPTVRVYARPTSAFLTDFRLLQANPASKMAVLETVLADSACNFLTKARESALELRV
ncbi:uncharacterized protein N7529_007553 [Penicillium soppii]|uniref:uncharacterized protein n=1 Tax=Penicillium soppii TaxID=69789 RepID=UPI002547AEF6|nr:uncharacterized protein N7529_007553 [Penicillium soppii]KAJ5860243.1 hypothetical protein N7529_007553 [Penicillium soppii]